jgi:hypothetical protein
MDKFTELVGSEITARFLKPPQETQEVLQRVVHLLNEAQTIDIPYNHCHLNGVEFGWKVRGIRDQVIALLGKSKQPYVTEWVGLTEEEIMVIGDKVANEHLVGLVSNFRVRLARAIEQTLKERNT